MCGIYGFTVAAGDLGPPEQVSAVLSAMDHAIVHRGPDDSGRFAGDRCAFGMRRLSIIDLDGGHQPIANENGRVVVVFNGEIYNYRALQSELRARGHQLSTSSDTEVLVHLYEERGAAFVEALSGMFGFALWDEDRQELLLARDRLGIKPLYYAPTPRGLVFGSELKSLLCHPDVRQRVSPEALSHYLSFGTTPTDQSILDGVRKLGAGEILLYRAGEIRVRRYWDLPIDAPPLAINEADAAAEVRQLIRDAVRSHLIADVPVGAFLSGGIDSATVVGTMTELGVRPKTFSIGFEELDYDELTYARMVARRFGTDHHELVVRPDAFSVVEKITWYLDEPFADMSAIPTFLVSQLAAEHVKVVLSGDGGDEVFAGYDRYAWTLDEERRFGWLPGPARRLLTEVSRRMPERARGKNYLRHIAQAAHLRYVDGQSLYSASNKARLLHPALMRELSSRARSLDADTAARVAMLDETPGDLVRRLCYLDTMTYLPLDILTKVDRMTMAHSLEARPPLLDHTLVEGVYRMPSALKLAPDGTQKAILKRAVADLVPREILTREKRGFGVPLGAWFRGSLKEPMRALLSDRRFVERGWLDPGAVATLIGEHLDGRRDHSPPLYALMMLELWARRFLDGAQTIMPAKEEGVAYA